MVRASRFLVRLLLAGVIGAGAYFAWISSFGSPAPVDVLPAGAFGVVELHDAEALSRRLSGTRFAATFARSATREWLERTDAVRAFDAALADFEHVVGVSPGRGSAFDLLGANAAMGWYPPDDGAAAAPWVAGWRLSARAWVVATTMRLGWRFGLGAMGATREEAAGRTLYSFPGDAGQSLHVFLAGRVLVGGTDRSLVLKAARALADPNARVTNEPAWRTIRGALPAQGELFAWVRERNSIPGALSVGLTGHGSAGIHVRAGTMTEIDMAAAPASGHTASKSSGGVPPPLPGIGLLRQQPLFFLTSREAAPATLTDLLQTRRSAVARRNPVTTLPTAAFQPGNGYAVAITESAGEGGLFPAPRGLVAIDMASVAEASRALSSLFPPGARSGSGGGTRALATSESFPLAGQFELWGAAIGSQLIFATGTSLIDAAASDAGADAMHQPESATWPVDAIATISMEKLLPLLKRWSGPLSGLVIANWPEGPDIARDLDLLAAVGMVRVAAGSDDRFDRAAITIQLHDLR